MHGVRLIHFPIGHPEPNICEEEDERFVTEKCTQDKDLEAIRRFVYSNETRPAAGLYRTFYDPVYTQMGTADETSAHSRSQDAICQQNSLHPIAQSLDAHDHDPPTNSDDMQGVAIPTPSVLPPPESDRPAQKAPPTSHHGATKTPLKQPPPPLPQQSRSTPVCFQDRSGQARDAQDYDRPTIPPPNFAPAPPPPETDFSSAKNPPLQPHRDAPQTPHKHPPPPSSQQSVPTPTRTTIGKPIMKPPPPQMLQGHPANTSSSAGAPMPKRPPPV